MTLAPSARLLVLAAAAAVLSTPAAAEGLRPSGAFFQAGGGEQDVSASASLGATWDWSWRKAAWGGEFSAATELVGTVLQADRRVGAGTRTYVQLGLVPVLRYRFGEGRSPWFVEGGIGLSVMDRKLSTPEKEQGTSWNFSDNLAVGRNFGTRSEHELSLRWQHTSNAGIRKPNPGFDLFFVRWTERF
jgi:lipid A 3-O-deacylase